MGEIVEMIDTVLSNPESETTIASVRNKVNQTMKDYPLAITAQKDEIDAKYLKSVIENIDSGKVKMIRKNLSELESLADA